MKKMGVRGSSKKKKGRNLLVVVLAIIITALLLGSILVFSVEIVDWFGKNTPFNFGGGGNNDGDNDNNDTNNDNNTPVIGSWITLSCLVTSCNRDDTVTYTVTSNFKNVQFDFMNQYQVFGGYVKFATFSVNNVGGATVNIKHANAGVWLLQVMHASSGILSNVKNMTVRGITIYQQKDTWHLNETYTGQLTGTYKMWLVAFFIKNDTDTTWTFARSFPTDVQGMILYGQLNVVIGGPPRTVNIIGVIGTDSMMSNNIYYLMSETQGCPTQADFDNEVAAGRIVISNILTDTIIP